MVENRVKQGKKLVWKNEVKNTGKYEKYFHFIINIDVSWMVLISDVWSLFGSRVCHKSRMHNICFHLLGKRKAADFYRFSWVHEIRLLRLICFRKLRIPIEFIGNVAGHRTRELIADPRMTNRFFGQNRRLNNPLLLWELFQKFLQNIDFRIKNAYIENKNVNFF